MESDSLSPAGLLQPLPIPSQVFEDISMNFIIGLPMSNGKEAIMVVVDRLTNAYIARVFMQGVVKLHGIPRTIVSDKYCIFLSEFWTELAKLQGTELCFSSAYHLQFDGQTEALNRCLVMYLRCMTGNDPTEWEKFLAWTEYWYNTAFQTSTGMTLFQALYGREPPTILTYLEGSSSNGQLAQERLERDKLLKLLKHNLTKAQTRMKLQADRHRRDLELAVGSLGSFKIIALSTARHQKLGPRFFGPYQVLQCIGSVAYKLDLLDSTRIHPVFHIYQLKPCLERPLQ
ncbi:peroxidase 64 [Gossypium australe]|uniref:Peroxidase 64 n=1 Tax=Gossypium australe TaxID=47621 RepID=A0A5B6WNG1_9ROSI|nr:peroxidase 64 [Gossypium australe]